MTQGEAIRSILRERGPLTRQELVDIARSKFNILPVFTISMVTGLVATGEVVVRDDQYAVKGEAGS